MTLVGTHLSPLRLGGVAISPLDEVEGVLYPLVQLVHGCNVLSLLWPHIPAAVRTLTADAARQDGNRLHTQVLAELEVLIVAQSHALVVAPCVLLLYALVARADGVLPAVGVPEAVAAAVYHTAAREAHELWLQVGQSLCQVLTQTVTLVGVLWHERQVVDVDVAIVEQQHLQGSLLAVSVRLERGLECLPVVFAFACRDVERCLCQQFRVLAPALRLYQYHTQLFGGAHIGQTHGEVVLCAVLHADTLETAVLDAEASPALEVVELSCALGVDAHTGVADVAVREAVVHLVGGDRLDIA